MKIKQIAGALGAEISGVDLSRGVAGQLATDIRQVFLDHQVIEALPHGITCGRVLVKNLQVQLVRPPVSIGIRLFRGVTIR